MNSTTNNAAPIMGAMHADKRETMQRNFILQMGFAEPAPEIRARQFAALTFQPRVVLAMGIAGVLSQSSAVFAALGAMLLWSALLPERNPFSAAYNFTFGRRTGAYRIGRTPMPRRGAETMAGSFSLAVALAIFFNFHLAAYALQAFFLAAALAVELGGFCFGTFAYHLRRGNKQFALATLPWAGTK